jgi:predicted SAM-dependent methyltransferase
MSSKAIPTQMGTQQVITRKSGLSQSLRRSAFVLGAVRTLRGLRLDLRVLGWMLGRKAKVSAYLAANGARKLQIGASGNLLPGWLNTDIFPSHANSIYLDATCRFPFENNSLDYIYSEHMIEHIDYASARAMLSECYRVLKPGGRIRVATPDLNVILALHQEQKSEFQRYYIDWAASQFTPEADARKDVFVINNFFRAWGHQFLYEPETLHELFSKAGFGGLQFFKPGVSGDPNLEGLESHGKQLGSEEINQFETMVIEGQK